ncbi:MAG: nucleotidyltransferase family protein [Bryobacteraceae bacterium]
MGSRTAAASATDARSLIEARPPALVRAVLGSTAAARLSAWREWREAADLDHLTPEEFLTLPCLGRDLKDWLTLDPLPGIFRGMLRRAWTENQLRLNETRAAMDVLEDAGCGPVLAAGAVTIALLNPFEGSVRPIPELRLAIPRERLHEASAALAAHGWRPSYPVPDPDVLDWVPAVHFSRHQLQLVLQWRLLPVTGTAAKACEAEMSKQHRTVVQGGCNWRVPGVEETLLAAMCGRFDFDHDPIHWAVDAALLPTKDVDWNRWSRLAAEFAPEAFDRLEWMRHAGWRAPQLKRPPAPKPAAPPKPAMPHALRAAYRRWRGRAGRVLRKMGLR